MTNHHEAHQLVTPRLYLTVWAALVALTGVTVGVSLLDMQHFTVFTALLIATAKSALVLLYFMHVRFQKPLYAVMIVLILLTYAIFVILAFSDYSFR